MTTAKDYQKTLGDGGKTEQAARQKVALIRNLYAGANMGRRLGGWTPSSADANRELRFSVRELRNRSRQQVRDNGLAKGAKRRFVSNVIGSGIHPRFRGDRKDELQAFWRRAAKKIDADNLLPFSGLQSLVAGTMFESGMALAHRKFRSLSDRLPVPLQVKILEPDHLDCGKDGPVPTGGWIESGVQFDRNGDRIGYWMFPRHPGNIHQPQLRSEFFPVDDIRPVHVVHRPGQVIGEPHLAAILVPLYELDKGSDAQLVAWQIANMLTGFIRSNTPIEELFPELPGTESLGELRAAFYEQIAGLEPGVMRQLFGDDEIVFSEPPDPGSNFADWTKYMIRKMAVGCGLTYHIFSGDYADTNNASVRAALIDFRREMEQVQIEQIVHQFCQPLLEWVFDAADAAGLISLPDYDRRRAEYLDVEWVSDPWEFVDPVKDRLGDRMDLEDGVASRSQIVKERGRDVEDVDIERAEDQQRAAELGIQSTDDNRTALSVERFADGED